MIDEDNEDIDREMGYFARRTIVLDTTRRWTGGGGVTSECGRWR